MKNRVVIKGLTALALAALGQAQETVNGGMTILGPLRSNGAAAAIDFTGSGSTSPVKSGTLASRPANCAVGQMFFITDAGPGQNLSMCTSPSTWTTITGSSATPPGVNAQSGTNYALVDGDKEKLVTFNNSSAVAVTLPQAGASSWFQSGWDVYLQNRGTGAVTITPATSTIDGSGSLVLPQNAGVRIVSDGTNFYTERGMGGGGGGGAVSSVAGKTGAVTLASTDLADITVPTITPSGNAAVNAPLVKCLDKTVSYSADLNQPAQIYSVVLGTFPAHWVFTDAWARETVTFASPSITSITASIGPAGSEISILPAVTLKQSANVVSAFSSGFTAADSATTIVAQFVVTAGGGNLSTLTAGTWDTRVCGHAGR